MSVHSEKLQKNDSFNQSYMTICDLMLEDKTLSSVITRSGCCLIRELFKFHRGH